MKTNVAWIPVLLCALVLPGFAKRPQTPAATSVPPTAKTTEVRGEAPVLHYTFGPSAKSARVRDRSGAGNDGMAARPLRRVPGIAEGRWAARFDGASDYIRVPRSPLLEPEELTVDAWVRIDKRALEVNGGSTIVFKRNTAMQCNEDYCLEILPSRIVHMTVSNVRQTCLDTTAPLSFGEWHHLAMTFRPGEAVVYVDGQANVRMRSRGDGDGMLAPLAHNAAADLFIGARDHAMYPMGRFAAFDLAELRIWPVALGAERIAALYGEHAGQSGVAAPERRKARCNAKNRRKSSDVVAPESLVLHYASGNSCKTTDKVRDRSGHHNGGNASRPLIHVHDDVWRAWRFDSAAKDFIRVPRSPSLEPEAVTVAAWVCVRGEAKPEDAGAIVFKRNNSFHDNEDYDLEILPDRRVRMTIGHTGGQKDVISRDALAPDKWHHVAMTFREGEMRLYVDGEPAGKGWFIRKLDHNPETDFFIGGRDHAAHPMDRFAWFDIADVRIWSVALDGGRIAKLYEEFADRPHVARHADNRPAAAPPRKDDEPFFCGTPVLPPDEPATNVPPCVRRDDLVLHYEFDRAPGKVTEVRDRGPRHNDGVAANPMERVRGPGNLASALRFDGVGDYIRVPRSPSMENDAVTVAAWVRIGSDRPLSHNGTVVFKRNLSFHQNEDYHMEICPDRTVNVFCGDGSGGQQVVRSRTPLSPDLWHHLSLTAGDGRIRLFVDGEPVASAPWPHTLAHNPEADLFIGAVDHASYPIGNFCPMDLADVRIWPTVFSDAKIAALYHEMSSLPDVAHPGENRSPEPPRKCGTLQCDPTRSPKDRSVRKDHLVLHYAFDGNASGTAIPDCSGCHNDGHSFLTLEMVPGPGRTGGALRFGGPEDFIRTPRSPSLDPEAITVATWLKLDGARPMTKPAGTIVFKRNPSFYNNEDYHLEILREGTVRAVCTDSSGEQSKAVSPTAIAPDVWHHVAMSIGEGRIRLYVDGEPVATTPCTQPLNHNPEADLFIGAKDHVQFPMDHPCPMELAEVRIWSAVLSDAEIAALYREKACFPDVARPGANRVDKPVRVFPQWQPPVKDGLAMELRLLLDQGRRDRAASPEFLDALQRLLERHSGALTSTPAEDDSR